MNTLVDDGLDTPDILISVPKILPRSFRGQEVAPLSVSHFCAYAQSAAVEADQYTIPNCQSFWVWCGMATRKSNTPLGADDIVASILVLRRQRVLLDSDLAGLYGVSTKRFNEQVRRNIKRFPADFMFRVNAAEQPLLRSQIATSKSGHGGRRYAPYAFTEHGAIMAATILNSPRAIEMSVYVVRAFVQLRELLSSNKELAQKLNELESRVEQKLATHDQAITGILKAIRELMNPPIPKNRPIGFTANLDEK